ncbi:MAG TPA: TIGR03067 domain-containing protein [Planctomycetaceae bacterium]|nr:TIGR03067 domain-containing protein [Planctomycetaceae bacterium]
MEALRADFAVATAEYLPSRHGTERDQPDFDLQGAWHAIHANVDGRELPKHDVAHVSELLEFHGGSAWLRNGDRELLRGQYDVDESRTPHVIRIDSDLLMGDLSNDHGPVHGIFEVSDDSLRICFTSIDRPLPANFQPQSHETCMTYKRVP